MDDTGALLRFVQRPNRVSLGEGEAALRAAGRYSELVALYQERGQFEAALDLLRALSLVRACPLQAPPTRQCAFPGPFHYACLACFVALHLYAHMSCVAALWHVSAHADQQRMALHVKRPSNA